MKVDDRSAIAEHLIYQLWERNYFSTIPQQTIAGEQVTIISTGIKKEDSGPDFNGITIKIGDQVFHGDLEIHRAPEDWYQHSHHADPAYNNVIMPLVIGPEDLDEPAIHRLIHGRKNRLKTPKKKHRVGKEYSLRFPIRLSPQ